MARIDNLENFLTDVATAIKEKKGDDTPIPATNFDTEITNLPSGGGKYAPRYISFNGYLGTEFNEELELLDTSKMTNMAGLFYNCYYLETLDISGFDTSNVTMMSNMFNGCQSLTSLDVKNLNTSNVTSMLSMFASCNQLTTLDCSNFNTPNLTNLTQMFNNCSKLENLNIKNFITTKTKDMYRVFYGCTALTTIDMSGWDLSSAYNINQMFTNCTNLTNLAFGKNLGKGYSRTSANYVQHKLDLSTCTKLTHDSLMSVINNLYDLNLSYNVANGGTLYTQQLVLGSTNLAKLTADEIAIATNKGWTVS